MSLDYSAHDALGLAELLRKGEASPAELVDAAIERIERHNPALNAVVVRQFEAARARAAAPESLPEGRFRGVPFLNKDLGFQEAGVAMTNGSRAYKDYVAASDSGMIADYRRAGLIFCGRTNSPENGLCSTTEPLLHGPSRNPWDPARTPGGSSGGSAAAVAAGMVPAASASDGGGSIRIPASCCGLFGLKPTRGRIGSGPDVGEGWNGLAIGHAVTRSVRDSAALLDIASGPAPGDPYWAEPPARPFLDEVGADPGRLRVALCLETFNGTPVDPACAASAREAASLCESLGHHVEEAGPEIDRAAVLEATFDIISVQTALMLDVLGSAMERTCSADDVERATWRMAETGRDIPGVRFQAAIDTLHGAGRRLGRFFERYDILLTPTQPMPTPRLGWLNPDSEDQESYGERVVQSIGFTGFFNVTGVPAMSVPLHWTAGGLPQGSQFAAAYANEALLFRLAAQLEAAQPWAQRRPPGFGG